MAAKACPAPLLRLLRLRPISLSADSPSAPPIPGGQRLGFGRVEQLGRRGLSRGPAPREAVLIAVPFPAWTRIICPDPLWVGTIRVLPARVCRASRLFAIRVALPPVPGLRPTLPTSHPSPPNPRGPAASLRSPSGPKGLPVTGPGPGNPLGRPAPSPWLRRFRLPAWPPKTPPILGRLRLGLPPAGGSTRSQRRGIGSGAPAWGRLRGGLRRAAAMAKDHGVGSGSPLQSGAGDGSRPATPRPCWVARVRPARSVLLPTWSSGLRVQGQPPGVALVSVAWIISGSCWSRVDPARHVGSQMPLGSRCVCPGDWCPWSRLPQVWRQRLILE